MKRSLYCSLTSLKELCEKERTSWQFSLLPSLNCIYADYKSEEQDATLPDEDTYVAMFDGTSHSSLLSELNLLSQQIGNSNIRLVNNVLMQRIPYTEFSNGAISRNVLPLGWNESLHGVITIDETNDPEMWKLRRSWHENLELNKPYSWKDFIKPNIPVSNSAVIIDRYLFVKTGKRGPINVAKILNLLIPDEFEGVYTVTIFFEFDQVLGEITTPDKLKKYDISKALGVINNTIYNNLSRQNFQRVRIEYVAIMNPENFRFHNRIQEWKELYYQTHDRKIITNYYKISASNGIAASKLNDQKEEVASFNQTISFESLLHGVDNPDQKIKDIPYYEVPLLLFRLFQSLKDAPSDSYSCYYALESNPHKVIKCERSWQIIQNPLLVD